MQSGRNYSTWRTLSTRCPLADRVSEYGVSLSGRRAPRSTAFKLNLLLYGDSVDRYGLRRRLSGCARPSVAATDSELMAPLHAQVFDE